MGHIREPKGVDFVIQSEPLTDQARKEISEFIKNYKNKSSEKLTRKKPKLFNKEQRLSKH